MDVIKGVALIVAVGFGATAISNLAGGVFDWLAGGCKFHKYLPPPYHPPPSTEYRRVQRQRAIDLIMTEIADARAGDWESVRRRKIKHGVAPTELDDRVNMLRNLAGYPGTPLEVATAWCDYRDADWFRAIDLVSYNPANPNWLAQTLAARSKQRG